MFWLTGFSDPCFFLFSHIDIGLQAAAGRLIA